MTGMIYVYVMLIVIVAVAIWMLKKERIKKVKIVTFTGPSGAGKTTIVGELLKIHPEWKMVLSWTSREPRESDLPGEYKYNVSKANFLWRERRGEFIWIVIAHGNMYGTLLVDIHGALNSKHPSLMQIVPTSVKRLRASALGKVAFVFILPPGEEELKRRLRGRGELPKDIERRIADCKKWENEALLSGIPYEFVRNDGTVAEAVERVERIIKDKL